jgi:hypothetical protein
MRIQHLANFTVPELAYVCSLKLRLVVGQVVGFLLCEVNFLIALCYLQLRRNNSLVILHEAVPVAVESLWCSILVWVALPLMIALALRLHEVWHILARLLVNFVELERPE